jgi:hypothetical protein
MVITGLGGERLSESHIIETAEVLNSCRPKFVTFIGINADPNTRYAQKMKAEEESGINRPLNGKERTNQMIEMIKRFGFKTTLGCHGSDVHTFGQNDFTFGAIDLDGYNPNRTVRDIKHMADEYYSDEKAARGLRRLFGI